MLLGLTMRLATVLGTHLLKELKGIIAVKKSINVLLFHFHFTLVCYTEVFDANFKRSSVVFFFFFMKIVLNIKKRWSAKDFSEIRNISYHELMLVC